MWIIIVGFIVFVGILCVVACCEQNKKDVKKAAIEAYKQARIKQIESSPNVAIIAKAIVSRWGFPQRIEIDRYGVTATIKNLREYERISYESLGVTNIQDDDCSTLARALRDYPLLEDKYKLEWRCETSERDEKNWLELKDQVSSTALQEW